MIGDEAHRRDVHRRFAERFESHSEIQKIIGLPLPEFEVINSKLLSYHELRYEIEIKCTIEFKKELSSTFFANLDSICNLPYPEKFDANSSYFFTGCEKIERCWSKNKGEYHYTRYTDFGDKIFPNRDNYFHFVIASKNIAIIKYGHTE